MYIPPPVNELTNKEDDDTYENRRDVTGSLRDFSEELDNQSLLSSSKKQS